MLTCGECKQAKTIAHPLCREGQNAFLGCAVTADKLSRMKNRTAKENKQLAKIVLLLVEGGMLPDEEDEESPCDEQETDSEQEENSPTTQQSKRPTLTDGDLTQDYNPVQESETPPPGNVQVIKLWQRCKRK